MSDSQAVDGASSKRRRKSGKQHPEEDNLQIEVVEPTRGDYSRVIGWLKYRSNKSKKIELRSEAAEALAASLCIKHMV